jgi:hypothetical protein
VVGVADAAWLVSNIVMVPQFSSERVVRSGVRVYPRSSYLN